MVYTGSLINIQYCSRHTTGYQVLYHRYHAVELLIVSSKPRHSVCGTTVPGIEGQAWSTVPVPYYTYEITEYRSIIYEKTFSVTLDLGIA
jgi:hypothetical protein